MPETAKAAPLRMKSKEIKISSETRFKSKWKNKNSLLRACEIISPPKPSWFVTKEKRGIKVPMLKASKNPVKNPIKASAKTRTRYLPYIFFNRNQRFFIIWIIRLINLIFA